MSSYNSSEYNLSRAEIERDRTMRKVLQPPGGTSSGIFNSSPVSSPRSARGEGNRPADHNSSFFFGDLKDSLPQENSTTLASHQNSVSTTLPVLNNSSAKIPPIAVDSQYRKKTLAWLESHPMLKQQPRNQCSRNPITGENCPSYDFIRWKKPPRILPNSATNEGFFEGDNTSDSQKIPPGGKSTIVLQ